MYWLYWTMVCVVVCCGYIGIAHPTTSVRTLAMLEQILLGMAIAAMTLTLVLMNHTH